MVELERINNLFIINDLYSICTILCTELHFSPNPFITFNKCIDILKNLCKKDKVRFILFRIFGEMKKTCSLKLLK